MIDTFDFPPPPEAPSFSYKHGTQELTNESEKELAQWEGAVKEYSRISRLYNKHLLGQLRGLLGK